MPECYYAAMPHRAVLSLSGPDCKNFLQGLISNDIAKTENGQAIWAALLSPQGKYLHEFFLAPPEGQKDASEKDAEQNFWLEGEAERFDDLLKRLKLYRLRSKVTLETQQDGIAVYSLWGEGLEAAFDLKISDCHQGKAPVKNTEPGRLFFDPRHPMVGMRAFLPKDTAEAFLQERGVVKAELQDWDQKRIALALPDGSRDMQIDKTILLENGFDELSAVDWKKGCYVGQEVTARSKYRGLIKKRLLPLFSKEQADLSDLPFGSDVLLDGKRVGELRSVAGSYALALVRLEAAVEGQLFACGDKTVTLQIPNWVHIAE